MALAPPITITASLFPSALISTSAKLGMFTSWAPGISVPVTLKSLRSSLEIATA